jgi:cytochrome c peroxidase
MTRSWLAVAALLAACSSDSSSGDEPKRNPRPPEQKPADAAPKTVDLAPAPPVPPAPRGLPPTPSPRHNPTTPDKVALGKLLFFDSRLSVNGAASCAGCHDPAHSFGDPQRLSKTVTGATNLRHAPSLLNVAYADEYYWDGRVSPLEALIDANWRGQLAADPRLIAERLAGNPTYRAHFQRAFDGPPTGERIVEALAAYVRTLRSGNAPWDRYESGDADAVTPEMIAGGELFRTVAGCAVCHPPPFYTDHRYHNVGVGDPTRDPGRGRVTGKPSDLGAFRTPTLRGVARSAPYFHDGSAGSLAEVVDHYLAGTPASKPVYLTPDQKAQLIAFVRALTPATEPTAKPELP